MNLDEYLSTNRAELDATVTSLSQALATEDDTDRDRKRLASHTSKALKAAIKDLLKRSFREGFVWGAHGEVAVMIHQPQICQDLFGKFSVRAGRLSTDGLVPCPDDWPTSGMTLTPFLQSMFGAIHEANTTSRVITVSKEGEATLGPSFAGREFYVEEISGGELHWKPL